MLDLGQTVTAAQSGDTEAFNDLVRATYDDTYSLALRLVGNSEDAKDVVQDTYLRAYRALARFRGDAQIGTWLFRITSNCASKQTC
jgi:RNA polymerase sigma-70 factor, ECF subfamily